MTTAIWIAYVVGASLGLLSARNSALGRVWPVIVRAQMVVGAVALSIAAVWRIDNLDGILWPFLMSLAILVLMGIVWLTYRGPDRAAHAVLQAWAANSNTGFWVIPIGAALGGPSGALAAVLMDRIATPLYAWWVHILRRDAPRPQHRRTSWVDQSGAIALVIGLLLRLTGPAPEWTITMTALATPLLAASGAAVFVGSVLHPSQRIDAAPGVRRYLGLVAVRVVLYLPIVVFAPTTELRVVALLCALSIPAFVAPQISALYGYAEPVVAAANKLGWIFGALGLIVVWVLTRA